MSTHRWILLDASGAEIRATEEFASKEEAESWMGAEWSALLEEGAESVALVEGGKRIYEMGLREA